MAREVTATGATGGLTPPVATPILVIQVFLRNTLTERGGQHGSTTDLPVSRGETRHRERACAGGVVCPGQGVQDSVACRSLTCCWMAYG